jgi:hypothetical protein
MHDGWLRDHTAAFAESLDDDGMRVGALRAQVGNFTDFHDGYQLLVIASISMHAITGVIWVEGVFSEPVSGKGCRLICHDQRHPRLRRAVDAPACIEYPERVEM